jgi:hypothetical protein
LAAFLKHMIKSSSGSGSREDVPINQIYSFGDDGLFAYVVFPSLEALDQGQDQVASAHTPGFFREQFSGFEIVKRFPQSTMAGGQDLYVIRRPEHGRSIERPAFQPSETWSWTGRAGIPGSTNPVELTFNLSGHREFRVHVTLEPQGYYWPEFRIEILDGERVLASEEPRFTTNRIFGSQHYHSFLIPVPSHHGMVRARLSAAVSQRGNLPDTVTPEVKWCFPHFC